MIHYLVTRTHAYTMASFLESWGRALAGRIRIVAYEDVLAGAALPTGRADAYIFSDLDRLAGYSVRERGLLGQLRDHLVETCGARRVLNHPERSLLRFALLQRLYASGRNRFGVWRATQSPERYPVFLRGETGFERRAPPLLRSAEEYARALQEQPPDGLLAVEFCDTSMAGVFRKYGAFVVGERIVPRHLFFSRGWMVKEADLRGDEELREELAYVDGNPHAAQLAQIAATAEISYGRIDYGLLGDRVQTWEINTNPLIANLGPTMGGMERNVVHERFTRMFESALEPLLA